MREVPVNLRDRSYPIFIQPSGLETLGQRIQEFNLGTEAAVISDTTVSILYGDQTLDVLRAAGIQSTLHTVPDGEESKSLDRVSELYTLLIESNLLRDGLVIALGGGVVGDLAGFVAATYLRGVKLIQVPTTLLAQVDSSVGGKVGINHPLGKNLIGSFYQPKFVLIDPSVLSTLDKREIWAGLGEVVKYGLICDKSFITFLENNLDTITELRNDETVSESIAFCCQAKADVVQKDERESGLRRILNFGHTLGHALEAITDYRYFRHGEAVVHGMRWASWVSQQKGYLSESDSQRIQALLSRFPIPPLPPKLDPQELTSKTLLDKKQTDEGLYLVLLKKIGSTTVERITDLSDMIKGWLRIEL